jgi:(1->4)-alpha-D-glucan 1-alpha-D-glucosylmutase
MITPTATYRIQLNDHFRFRDLDAILEYLHDLGISTVYASPVTMAFKGSQHGYDVADPLRLNPEIGTEEEFGALAEKLRACGMNWLQDIVPNHMVYATQNPWLYDVLERGKVSPYYSFFDLHPDPVELLGDRIMAPFLGAPLTECISRGELTMQFGRDGFVLRYYDTDWPVAAHMYAWICTVTGDCPENLGKLLEELVIASLSPVEEWKAAKGRWLRQVDDDPLLAGYVRRRVDFFNERVPLLETLIGCQHYALTHHRLSSSLINYRRFFTVNSLICLRMESREVFDAYHRKIAEWWRRGWIQGLRIDHIDGLAAPAEYIRRLRELCGPDNYIVAEKILARDETLPGYWELQGTTGYEFLATANQVLTDAGGSRKLLDWYRREVIGLPDYPELVTERKYSFLRTYMGGELDNLMAMLEAMPALGALGQNAARLREALAMMLACWPVYRLYPDGGPFTAADRVTIASAFDRARQSRPDLERELSWFRELFGFAYANPFLLRLMQFTGPLAAKGIEDTSFYIYNPYIAHCEVGDTPAVAGIEPPAFHRFMQERQSRWPYSLNCTTTHDTKRGEDARIRLNWTSAQPAMWIEAVSFWRELNRSLITEADERRAPSANDEYLIYQALLGGWPEDGMVTDEFRERFSGYLRKALREARAETNYDEPDEWYEGACQEFAAALLAPESEFLRAFGGFAVSVIRESYAFSLAQLLLKLTAPGIPDIYQGAECWDISFVDPDNRRPVDFARRVGLLREIRDCEAVGIAAALGFALNHPERGAIKMWVIYRALNFRRQRPELFAAGEYIPVNVEGPALAYIRRHADEWVLVLVPLISAEEAASGRIRVGLPAGAPEQWTHLFTGDVHHLSGGVLEWSGWDRFPVAMLIGG